MGEADLRDAAGRVLAVLRDAGRAECTVGSYRVVLDRFAVFLAERGLETASEGVCVEFVAEQTGVRLESLRDPVTDRRVRAVRRAVVLMADVLAGRGVEVDRSVMLAKDGCPGRFRPVRDEYVACCRERGNAEATVASKDKAASRLLAYLEDVGVDDLVALGVRDVSGFLLRERQRGLGRKTIAAMRSCVADFLRFLAVTGLTPCGLAERMPPHRHVRHESEPHLWTADEIRRVLGVIDRRSACGKRDYAMILTTARLGLRISDLRQLELGDLDWRSKTITIVQRKTHRRLSLPLLD
ncbi:MAG: tyrosine-type recombinase/integrase, partial [Pseudonocardiaceae bacterium]